MPHFDSATALIVVDVQNDFADPRGSLYVSEGELVVTEANAQIRAAQGAGAPVFYTQDWHPAVTSHFQKDGGIWPAHCVAGSWGAAFHPGLDLAGEVIRKGTGGEDGYSGFTCRDPVSGAEQPTGLDALLKMKGVRRLVVVGLATDYCVQATVLDGLRLGYPVLVLQEGIRAVDLSPRDGATALATMRAAGAGFE